MLGEDRGEHPKQWRYIGMYLQKTPKTRAPGQTAAVYRYIYGGLQRRAPSTYVCNRLQKGWKNGLGTIYARGLSDDINIRILQTMISGVPLMLGLGTRMSDPYAYVVFGAPICWVFLLFRL